MTTLPDRILQKFRDTLWLLCPPWLQHGYAQAVLYAVSVQLDAGADALNAGVKIRFPGVYTPESLGMIGAERRIRRGLSESDANYAQRLVRWLEDHKRRGGPYAMLDQMYWHYAPDTFPITISYPSGAVFSMDAAGEVTWNISATPNFDAWSQIVILYFTDTLDPSDAEDIRTIPREWLAAHVIGELVLMPAGARLWGYPRGAHLWGDDIPWGSGPDGGRFPIRG